MSAGDRKGEFEFLCNLPPKVLWDFCLIMDGLSDLDWTRFASVVLSDQSAVRLAERMLRRTDWVMNQWGNRKGRVCELIDLLESLQLLRPRDVILDWVSSVNPPPPPLPLVHPPPPHPSQFDPPPKPPKAPPTAPTRKPNTTDEGGGRRLPTPAPPPTGMQSHCQEPPQPHPAEASWSGGVICWSYEEVHAGTEGFSPALQVGEGGFGVVYRATLSNTDCAVKRLKQDSLLDWTRLKESFQTEVDKLSKFRHPNIVDLLGFSEGGECLCLIYSYMDNRSLEDQLHNECLPLSWSQRVSIVKEASTALQFLHSPPKGQTALIHGDVKSSNILLDRHLVAKLADFGLARFASCSSLDHTAAQTVSVGMTATVRGTLAYLPDEYVRHGKLETAVDVYSFGVVLLEVLTGRRALERDRKSGERYLKDLVVEVEDSPAGLNAAAWQKQLHHQLIIGGAAEPADYMEMVTLACRCLDRNRKKRPAMTKVFSKLREIHNNVMKSSCCSQSLPRAPSPVDSSVGALSQQLSKMGPLEDTYPPTQSRQLSSSSSSSSFCSLTPPDPLQSSSSLSSSSSSFAGPCETDESRGFSQYNLHSHFRSNRTSSRSLSPSNRDQHGSPAEPADSQVSQSSVPAEDMYNFPPQPCSTSNSFGARALTGAPKGPDARKQATAGVTAGVTAGTRQDQNCGVSESFSPVRSLHSVFPGPSVHINPSKQHFLQKKTLYEEGRIQTPELLSSDNLYGDRSSGEFRGPEESDELDYLPAKHD